MPTARPSLRPRRKRRSVCRAAPTARPSRRRAEDRRGRAHQRGHDRPGHPCRRRAGVPCRGGFAGAAGAGGPTEARIFRGYEVILKGRAPTDAIDISSRACGVCGGVHATCAAMALEMACGVRAAAAGGDRSQPGRGGRTALRSLTASVPAGRPDYSEAMVRPDQPIALESRHSKRWRRTVLFMACARSPRLWKG